MRRVSVSIIAVGLATALVGCGNTGGGAAGESTGSGGAPASNEVVITYNSPEQWGNFGEVLSTFTSETGIAAPNDPKNSGQTLAALQAEKSAPVADAAYVGIAFGEQLAAAGVLQKSTPARADQIPAELKSPDGLWYTVHTGTVAFIVNKRALNGLPTPQSWKDLLKPEYSGLVGYLDPSQAAVGYSVATAVNEALGGSLDDWEPGLGYLEQLRANGAVTLAQTATAKVGQGEIPILIDTDFNGYQLRDQGSDVEVVIPAEGSLQIPYVVGKVNGAPNSENADELLDFYFSEQGQGLFAKGYMRPVIGEIPEEMRAKMLPQSDYERARTVDYVKQGEVQAQFVAQYVERVGK
ncbi:extracellular solute-binding protein [Leucobacter sp. wl10]|uniref:extracellular solute-binding protein n=1 Tax=Leucobacter sp. wl10 TaxID=2304677 RepID=UPI000E5A2006|nr:extracellular solute-binding protein [Leucobacter sp. wl10]RGE24400.1 extracellular solute-binding protein [Leucobacter sp. wl10]